MSNKISVLIVDDSSFMRSLLKRLIEKDERFEVIANAKNGEEGVKLAKELNPDIVTMDVEMPVMNGLEALKLIMKEDPRPVVMVSSLTEKGASATMQALELGAVDFIPKAMQDTEKNILQAGDILHQKLFAAANVRNVFNHRSVSSQSPAEKVDIPVKEYIKPTVVPSKPQKIFNRSAAKMLVIGSSTGGPRALSYLIAELPKLPVPVVIAQHMPAKFTAAMAERIDKASASNVKEAVDKEILKAGTVYIAPGGFHMRINDDGGKFVVDIKEDVGESVYKPSVEVLGRTVLRSAGKNIVAVMLTGMGSDGSKAFKEIHNAGGYVLAQNKETCVVYGMSRSVVESDGADEVLSLEDIKRKIVHLLG